MTVSKLCLGTMTYGTPTDRWPWALNEEQSRPFIKQALELGFNFFDTADVYGDGRSERLVARLKRERSEKIYVATKAGRRLSPHTAEGYNLTKLTEFVERSLKNLETDCLDLVQLHCPPVDAYYRPEVFEALDKLMAVGKIRHYGVSNLDGTSLDRSTFCGGVVGCLVRRNDKWSLGLYQNVTANLLFVTEFTRIQSKNDADQTNSSWNINAGLFLKF